MVSYLKNALVNTQRDSVKGMVENSAHGFSFSVDDWKRLERFLILSTEGGSYYATEHQLTRENGECVRRCIAADGPRTVSIIQTISQAGRAPKNDPALFALAMCAKEGDLTTRQMAWDALPYVARIGTHLFHFATYLEMFGGWGRASRNGVSKWYTDKTPQQLANQLVKYRQRDGWSHRDLLRLSHPKVSDETMATLFRYATQGWEDVGSEPHPHGGALEYVWAFETLQRQTSPAEAAKLIRQYKLPREAVPSELLNDHRVWSALLEDMPLEAMVRNLATMTRVGILAPLSSDLLAVTDRLHNESAIIKARLHPIKLLSALCTYEQGHGERGKNTWTPVPQIIDALDGAFYLAFGAVEPSKKRTMLALDVSGSMDSCNISGVPGLTPRKASAAMALVTAATEPQYTIVAFTSGNRPSRWTMGYSLYGNGFYSNMGSEITVVDISPKDRLTKAIEKIAALPMGGTDCALPMLHATETSMAVDVFCTYTDSETWAGDVTVDDALCAYRKSSGIAAKAVTVGMVANPFTLANPNDAGQLDVVGFDTNTPAVIADFSRG